MVLKKLQKLIFVLLVIFLPSQLGRHFWPEWAYVSGVRVDYFSLILYVTDILVLALVVLEFFISHFSFLIEFSIKQFSIVLLLLLFVSLNVYFSLSPAVSAYKWLKVAEFGFLAWWIARRCPTSLFSYLPTLLLIPVFYESVLAIWQFFAQSSIGGMWYFLGERSFSAATPGIANAYFDGQLVLRPYGTFSHPNVLGGFLAVVLPLILAHFLQNSRKIPVLGKWVRWAVLGLGYTTLAVSLSRVAILVGLTASLVVLWQKVSRKKVWLGILAGLGMVGIVLWPRFMALSTETEAIVARGQLNNLAGEQFFHSPVWGTGLGTAPLLTSGQRLAVSNYALAFQPAHNIYLLLLSETGVVGLGLFFWLVRRSFRKLAVILILGLFDHYFLTIQQGQLLLVLVLGLALGTRQGKT